MESQMVSGQENLSLKDTAQIGGAAVWGHPEAEGNKGQKRLWEPDAACEEEAVAGPALGRAGADTVRGPEEKGFNLPRTPAKSITSSATQLLFPRHQLQ